MNSPTTGGIKLLHARGYALWPGVRVKTLNGEKDTDHTDAERITPSGSVGWIESANPVASGPCVDFNVCFDNGAAVVLTREELDDSTQYKLAPPRSLRDLALYLKHGTEIAELSMYDESMIAASERLVTSFDELLVLTSPFRQLANEVVTMPTQDIQLPFQPDRSNRLLRPPVIPVVTICSSLEQIDAATKLGLDNKTIALQQDPAPSGHAEG